MSESDGNNNNINVNIQKIILLKFLTRLNYYISSKLTFENNSKTNPNNMQKVDIKSVMEQYMVDYYTNSQIKNFDTSIIYIILQSLCNEKQSNDNICLEWQKYWKYLIVPRNPGLQQENGEQSVNYLTKTLVKNINTVAEFVDNSQKADAFSYRMQEIIRNSGITDQDVEDKIIGNLESTIAAIKSVNKSKKDAQNTSETERLANEKERYDKEQNEKSIKELIERIEVVFNDTENLLKNNTTTINAFKENLKTNFITNDNINLLNKTEFSILYRKDFITDFETTLKEAIKKQQEYNKLLNEFNKEELNNDPFKDEIRVLQEKGQNLDTRINELEDLIKESTNFINSLVNPNKKDEELQQEANKIVNHIVPPVTSSENPNKNALLASITAQYTNQSSFPFFPFLLNNYSPIPSPIPPISNNKNARLATIASQYMNKNSISIFPFFFLTPSKSPPKIDNHKNALIASIVSHETNNNNLNMFGFFQQLAEETAAKAAATKAAEEAARKAEEARKAAVRIQKAVRIQEAARKAEEARKAAVRIQKALRIQKAARKAEEARWEEEQLAKKTRALLASIVSHQINNNNLNMFGFFQQLAEAEAEAEAIKIKKEEEIMKAKTRALLASIVSHQINNNNLNMFGFFQQLAEAEAAKAIKIINGGLTLVTEFDKERKGLRQKSSSASSASSGSSDSLASPYSVSTNDTKKDYILQRDKSMLDDTINKRKKKLKQLIEYITLHKNILNHDDNFKEKILETLKKDIMNITELSLPSYKILAKLNIKNGKSEIYTPVEDIKNNLEKIFRINNTKINNYTEKNDFITKTSLITKFNTDKYDYILQKLTFRTRMGKSTYIRKYISNTYSDNELINEDHEYIKNKFKMYKEICNEILHENTLNPFGNFDVKIEQLMDSPEEIVTKYLINARP